ncbi:hypothetical protein D3C77_397930 [compost metagenome]
MIAIRAIRTFVTATHRLSDDLELSYTLFVASIEALAQKFDGHIAEWEDYEQGKRSQIDKALNGAEDITKEKVRAAILKIEHTALSRRFKDFAIKHIPSDFFSGEGEISPAPIGRVDLQETLKHAYAIRSKYMHELQELPEDLKYVEDGSEVVIIENRTLLTFQGLSRLAREVIIQFVQNQEVLKVENYDYTMEIPGVRRIRWSPEMWISDPSGVEKTNGSLYLEGYIFLLAKVYSSPDTARLRNVSEVLKAAIKKYPNMSTDEKRPFAVLHRIWNATCGRDEYKVALELELDPSYIELTEGPSVESLVAHAVVGSDTEWSAEDHGRMFKSYFTKREKPDRLRLSRDIEACICLAYAERLRKLGETGNAKSQLLFSAESFVGYPQIRRFLEDYDESLPIEWVPIVYPKIKSKAE